MPFGAAISGFTLTIPSTVVPPLEEKEAMVGGLTPYAGVLLYNTAPTAIAPSALTCPTMVDAPLSLYSLNWMIPRKTTYFKATVVVPEAFTIKMFVESPPSPTVNGKTSMGLPPVLSLLNPKRVVPSSFAR